MLPNPKDEIRLRSYPTPIDIESDLSASSVVDAPNGIGRKVLIHSEEDFLTQNLENKNSAVPVSSQDNPMDSQHSGSSFEKKLPNPTADHSVRRSSEQTILSFSPPLEVLTSSTVDHQLEENELTVIFSKNGMLPQGTQLAHFVIKKYIGGGGMGRVYLGIDQALDRKVAIKVLPIQRARDQASVARFMNEAKSAARLNHEHIAQVYFAGEQCGIPFIAFEYVQGINIRTYVEENGVLPLSEAIHYLLQITQALAHAATHQVIHRDVKPSNILITPSGRAKLIDMGLARLLTHSDNDLTASGVTLGTFDYISPEQARDPRNADARSDIYSLGCTFFFMLTGRPPFPEGTVLQKLLQHQGDTPPDVREFQPDIPVQVSQIIQKMMAKDPKMRYQTAAELVENLSDAAKIIGLQPFRQGNHFRRFPGLVQQSFIRHIPWLIPLCIFGVFFLLVKGGIIFQETNNLPTPEYLINRELKVDDKNNRIMTEPFAPQVISDFSEKIFPKKYSDSSILPNFVFRYATDTAFRQLNEGNILSFFTASDSDNNNTITEKNDVGVISAIRPQLFSAGLEVQNNQGKISQSPNFSGQIQRTPPIISLENKKTGNVEAPTKLIVDPTGRAPNSYTKLSDAARDAAKEAVIEIIASDPVEIEYFRFTDSKITIKGSEGRRPKLVFQPTTDVVFTTIYSLAALTNSQLTFENIDMEMVLSQSIDVISDRWTMFDLIGWNTVELRNVNLTINNARYDQEYRESAAFFRCSPNNYAMIPVTTTGMETSLKIYDSFIRGEASLLRCDSSRSVQIALDNTLIAVNQPVFSLQDVKPVQTIGAESHIITANLSHNTIYAPTMVSWQRSKTAGTLGHPIILRLTDSIVRFNKELAAIAEYAGGISQLPDVGGFYERISTRTFYQNLANEWIVRSPETDVVSRSELIKENSKYLNTVVWETLLPDGILSHNIRKEYFLLDAKSSNNPALKSDLEGRSAGIFPDKIPKEQ
ncbi:MAG: serine/threonine protein kinase [Planctomycetaceae bacterium]|jgi:serine/threonine protein kinase|nr:serine/threonine protein kinase [Planctomycetaceae bacterium]